MLQEIQELYAYNRWADERLLTACSGLSSEELERDLGSSFPSILATLSHILHADWIWLERWHGRSPGGPPEWDLSAWPNLLRHWSEVEQGQEKFLQELSPGDLNRTVNYRNTRGTSFTAPLWQLARHVVNHSTYHRGQVATMLRQIGAPAPSTDLILYYRERAPAILPEVDLITPT